MTFSPFHDTQRLSFSQHLSLVEVRALEDLPSLWMLNFIRTKIETLHWLTGLLFIKKGLLSLRTIQLTKTELQALPPDNFYSLMPQLKAVETPDTRTDFDDLASLGFIDLDMKECEVMNNIGIVHGKVVNDYVDVDFARVRTRTSAIENSFGPQVCVQKLDAEADANTDTTCKLCANIACTNSGTRNQGGYGGGGGRVGGDGSVPFTGRCCHTSKPRSCTRYINPYDTPHRQ